MAPKKKGNKMELGDFLHDESMGSWADDDLSALPTMPTAADPLENLNQRASRFNAPASSFQRPEVQLPTHPPFTAYLGNLPFTVTEESIVEFLGGPSIVSSVRFIRKGDEFAGFGYGEFFSVEGLKSALALNGRQVGGRAVRINVAEAPSKTSRRDDDERFGGAWRRDGPSSRGPREEFDIDKFSTARGAKFTPAPADGQSRSPFDRYGSVNRGDNRPRSNLEEKSTLSESGAWRRTTSQGSLPPSSANASPQIGRKKLEIQPRSVSAASSEGSQPSANTAKHNPFGAAAPVDTATREREIEAKLEKSKGPSAPPSSKEEDSQPSVKTNKPSPFGAAAPVDTATREREIEAKLEKSKGPSAPPAPKEEGSETGSTTSATPASAPAPVRSDKPKPNPFGAAQPVDSAAREKQIEEKLEREQTAARSASAEATRASRERQTAARGASAEATRAPRERTPEREDPAVPKGGHWKGSTKPRSLSQEQTHPKKDQSYHQTNGSSPSSGQSHENSRTPQANNAGEFKPSLRKEGFSYSSMAQGTPNVQAAAPEDSVTKDMEDTKIDDKSS